MAIETNKNPELSRAGGPGDVGNLAAGSSNSNSHNRGGASEIGDINELVSQLSRVLPRLEEIASRSPGK